MQREMTDISQAFVRIWAKVKSMNLKEKYCVGDTGYFDTVP